MFPVSLFVYRTQCENVVPIFSYSVLFCFCKSFILLKAEHLSLAPSFKIVSSECGPSNGIVLICIVTVLFPFILQSTTQTVGAMQVLYNKIIISYVNINYLCWFLSHSCLLLCLGKKHFFVQHLQYCKSRTSGAHTYCSTALIEGCSLSTLFAVLARRTHNDYC